ncbi:hypothetical protein [Mesorhizobium sp. M0187]|uniref:hypothetical protein n=1 Tax=unclassified Mesorhizobium TaxID=325217 RepID=UPI00333755B9
MPPTSMSSTIDPDQGSLGLVLSERGKQYDFLDVPLEAFVAFKSAFPKGRYSTITSATNYAFRLAQEKAAGSLDD